MTYGNIEANDGPITMELRSQMWDLFFPGSVNMHFVVMPHTKNI